MPQAYEKLLKSNINQLTEGIRNCQQAHFLVVSSFFYPQGIARGSMGKLGSAKVDLSGGEKLRKCFDHAASYWKEKKKVSIDPCD